jgi:hypothetical protein
MKQDVRRGNIIFFHSPIPLFAPFPPVHPLFPLCTPFPPVHPLSPCAPLFPLCTPVISRNDRNDENKQLTLLSQCKLTFTARNTLFVLKIIGAPKKIQNWPVLYIGLQLNIQKPNPSRETVPLSLVL